MRAERGRSIVTAVTQLTDATVRCTMHGLTASTRNGGTGLHLVPSGRVEVDAAVTGQPDPAELEAALSELAPLLAGLARPLRARRRPAAQCVRFS